ncbi:glycosyltransferase [Palleronia sp. LCG004]|uniref:glycosyltransferase n=1 Tax=Palleronia sp. LCG004 TaxID=3079304 RepID=UPI002942D2EE|nr:glycosyltransferase [Palleronia sp. LCG004]WOI55707.1 glycosyltransferase [Palleronia sp. LCG004]
MTSDRHSSVDALRLGLVVHEFPVISETFVTTLAAGLLRSGQDLRILATNADAAAPRQDILDAYGLPEARIMRARYQGRLSLKRGLDLARRSPRHSPGYLGLMLADRISPARLAVTRLMADAPDFDVVHAQFGVLGLLAARHRRWGTLRTRALVVHLRGYDITRHVEERGVRVYARLFREADLFIANCRYFRDKAIALGCPADKIIVIGSPIDTRAFSPPANRRVSEGPTRLVAVGRLVEKKGFSDAVAAIGHLIREGHDVTLEILGDGPLRSALAAQISEAGLTDRVMLAGSADRGQVIEALHRADIALTPSVRASSGDEDANVNTAKEAMATGLPVIGTHHGGIPELVIPGENGDLVPERDPRALADAIAAMMGRRGDWADLGTAGRRKVLEEFDQGHIVEETLLAYRRALTIRRDRP